MKKSVLLLIFMFFTASTVFADDFKTFYDNGQAFLQNSQYSNAISEFKKALRINYLDNSARISLINSYIARGAYYANSESDYDKASNDFRAALFYLKYYADEKEVQNSLAAIQTTTDNLEQCMSSIGQSKSPQERYNRGVILRKNGNLPAAAYEFFQALKVGDSNVQKHSYAQIGDIMAVLANNKKAVEFYRKSVAIDPDNVGLRLKYARMLDKLNQDDLAVQEYNFVLSKGSASSEILSALEKIYIKKLAANPNSAEINANLGAIMQKQKKYDEALNYYKNAETLNPSSVTTRLNIGTLYQQKKDFNSALSAYNSVLSLYPNNLEANLYRAQVLVKLGEKDEALTAFKKVLSIDPTSVLAKCEIFDLLKDKMTPEQMITYFSQDATVDKSSVTAMYEYAKELHQDKKLQDAINCYNTVIKYDSTNAEAYANLAICYLELNNLAKAESIINSAKAKFPTNAIVLKTVSSINEKVSESKYDEANKYFTNSEYQKALDIYLTINPQPRDVLIAIAACYKGINNIDKAIEYYKKAFTLDSTNSDIAYYIGVLYAEKENWTSAKIYLQNSVKLNPKNENAIDLLSTVIEQNNVILINKVINYYNAKNYDSALKLLSQILTEDNKNAYAYYYRGLIYDAQHKSIQAIEEYKKAIAHNSELVISDYLIATAYDSLGQYSNAYTYYKKFVASSQQDDDYKKYAVTRLSDLKNYAKPVK